MGVGKPDQAVEGGKVRRGGVTAGVRSRSRRRCRCAGARRSCARSPWGAPRRTCRAVRPSARPARARGPRTCRAAPRGGRGQGRLARGRGGAPALGDQLVVPSVVDLRAWSSGEHWRGRGAGAGVRRARLACSRRSLAAWSDSSGVTRDSGLYPGRPSPDPRQSGVKRTRGARRRRAQRAARRAPRGADQRRRRVAWRWT